MCQKVRDLFSLVNILGDVILLRHGIMINGSLNMSFQLEMHHFLWISHQFWVSPLLTLRSACVLIERKFTAIFASRRSDPGVEFILCNTLCWRWVHENFSSSWAWCFALVLALVLCTALVVLGDLHWAWCFALVLGANHCITDSFISAPSMHPNKSPACVKLSLGS